MPQQDQERKKVLRRARYQRGCIVLKKQANGQSLWLFRYRERQPDGSTRMPSTILGTLEQLPDRDAAERAADGVRLTINQPRHTGSAILFGALIERYVREAMPSRYSTQCSYLSNLNQHIRPRWAEETVATIAEDPYAVERWLISLPVAPKTKTHVKSVMHRLFEFAMKWRVLPLQRNPISLVEIKGGSRRRRRPQVLHPQQCLALMARLPDPYRTMVLIAICLGLRVNEILALQWRDFDFATLTVLVQRGVVHGHVDEVKTEYSEDELPLDPALAATLLEWRARCPPSPQGWVFPNPETGRPYHASPIQQDYIRKAGRELGLGEHIGWHTFRHSYRSWLDAAGTPLGVQQKLLRHASITTTMDVYGNALLESKREANSKVVRLLHAASRKQLTSGNDQSG